MAEVFDPRVGQSAKSEIGAPRLPKHEFGS